MLNMEQESFLEEIISNKNINSKNSDHEKLIDEINFYIMNQPEYSEFLLPLLDILINHPESVEYLFNLS